MKGRPRIHQLVGRHFGRLKVEREAPRRGSKRDRRWHCRCQCGKVTSVRQDVLLGGGSLSCGCLLLESRITHGATRHHRKTAEYELWRNMRQRCHNPRADRFPWYGARGIRVCAAWRKSFSRFLSDVGLRPSPQHSLDRIDNHGHYAPGNVRWVLRAQQASNKRNNVRLVWQGVDQTVSEWARDLGVPVARLCARVRAGWPVFRTLMEPSNA